MKTIAETFEDFKARVYSRGMEPDQEMQIKNAYFAGQVQMFGTMNALGELPEEQVMKHLDDIHEEMDAHFALANQQAVHAVAKLKQNIRKR